MFQYQSAWPSTGDNWFCLVHHHFSYLRVKELLRKPTLLSPPKLVGLHSLKELQNQFVTNEEAGTEHVIVVQTSDY
jgi:hypothetical protein